MPNADLTPNRPEYYVQTGSMFENPYGVPHDEIVAMLLELPAEVAAQVIFGKYVESSGLVFTGELIQNMIDRSLPRVTTDRWYDKDLVEQARMWGYGDKGWAFHGGVDFARQTDFTVIYVLDTRERPARVVYYRRLNRVPWESIYREVGRAMSIFGPSFLGDATGPQGDVIFDALGSRLYCPVHDQTILVEHGLCFGRGGERLAGCHAEDYIPLSAVEPFQFATRSKKELIEHLRNCLSVGYRTGYEPGTYGWIRTPPIVQLEEEMAFYTWDDKGLETDCLMALALAAWQGLEDIPQEAWIGSPYGR